MSIDSAKFCETIIYLGRRHHVEHGHINVLGYQNSAENRAAGPNAMLLHIPGRGLTPDNFIDVGDHRDVLESMAELFIPMWMSAPGGAPVAAAAGDDVVHVFEHDIYTVVLANNPRAIPEALSQVDPVRRPEIKPELFDFYADNLDDHSFALCCFDNTDSLKSAPVMLWYPPTDPDVLVMPGIDCHTGGAPRMDVTVERDHTLLFSTDDAPPGWGHQVDQPEQLREFLSERVIGLQVSNTSRSFGHDPQLDLNGDFAIDHSDLIAGRRDRIRRVSPV